VSENDNSSPIKALYRVAAGNARFSSGLKSTLSISGNESHGELFKRGQKPFFILLTCSDSRISAEALFDCGIGEAYVFRVAGNLLTDATIAAMEYATHFFNVPLILVLGHTQCGAVHAAHEYLKSEKKNRSSSANIDKLIEAISADHATIQQLSTIDLTVENLLNNVRKITSESEMISSKVQNGLVKVVGAVYDLETCKVTFDLTDDENALLKELKSEERKREVEFPLTSKTMFNTGKKRKVS
jgi:carbonic anhydrase